jgi:hypothetical protein
MSHNRLSGDGAHTATALTVTDGRELIVRQLKTTFAALVANCNGDPFEAIDIAGEAMKEVGVEQAPTSEIEGLPGSRINDEQWGPDFPRW